MRVLVAGVTVIVVLACVGLAWWGASPPVEPSSVAIKRDLFGAPVDPADRREIQPLTPPEPPQAPPADAPADGLPVEAGLAEPFIPPVITAYA
ncbi:hypothetical protein JW859_06855 [bacterium]|nr:hypothetical protein [bacterium]